MALTKWGLALGGGGILGFAHIGVLMAMELYGLRPQILAGTSAGALVAGLYAAGVNLTGIQEGVEALAGSDEYHEAETALIFAGGQVSATGIKGVVRGGFIEKYIDKLTGSKRVSDIKTPLAIVSVDVETGEEVVFTNRPPVVTTIPAHGDLVPRAGLGRKAYITEVRLAEAIRASISLPGVFVPRRLYGRSLVDGGILNMVPVDELKRMEAEEIVAVDLGLHAERPQKAEDFATILSRCFALASRREVERSLHQYATVILQPEVWDVGIPTPSKIRALIESGKICAEKNMGRLRPLLA
jgi:NTE family protein